MSTYTISKGSLRSICLGPGPPLAKQLGPCSHTIKINNNWVGVRIGFGHICTTTSWETVGCKGQGRRHVALPHHSTRDPRDSFQRRQLPCPSSCPLLRKASKHPGTPGQSAHRQDCNLSLVSLQSSQWEACLCVTSPIFPASNPAFQNGTQNLLYFALARFSKSKCRASNLIGIPLNND